MQDQAAPLGEGADLARWESWIHDAVDPGAAGRDQTHQPLSRELWREAGREGLLGAPLPRFVGGGDWSAARWAGALRRLSYACDDLSFPFLLGYQQSLAERILVAGNPGLTERFVAPLVRGAVLGSFCWTEGADAFSFRTTARRTGAGYAVSGSKGPVSAGLLADFFLVYAHDAEREDLVALIVEREDAGVSVGAFPSMGLRATGQAELRLSEVAVPADRVVAGSDAVSHAQIFLNQRRAAIPAMVLGALERLHDRVVEDLEQRVRYGLPLTEMQAVQTRLGRMDASIQACRAMFERLVGRLADPDVAAADSVWDADVATAKYFVVEQARAVIGLAQEVLGGRWYYDHWPYGRWMRDLLGFVPAAGTQGILEVDLGVRAAAQSRLRAARRRKQGGSP